MFLSAPARSRREYYCEDSNYIKAYGTVNHLSYGEKNTYVYLSFESIPDAYGDRSFKVGDKNYHLLMERGFADKVQLGTQVEYISAPRIFWDGYSMPIVALSVNGEILLSFEEGKENFLDSIS